LFGAVWRSTGAGLLIDEEGAFFEAFEGFPKTNAAATA
jgi:hypothetical protein